VGRVKSDKTHVPNYETRKKPKKEGLGFGDCITKWSVCSWFCSLNKFAVFPPRKKRHAAGICWGKYEQIFLGLPGAAFSR